VNILDENIIDRQRQRLRHWRIAMRHMGYDVGRQGMKDQEILTLLHRLRRPTFFTRDEDFYACHLCHTRYCLVYLAVAKDEVAPFVHRLLRHREFDTIAKRMGKWSGSRTLILLSGASTPSKPSTLLGIRRCSEPSAGSNY
jgi:hypothetical protein